MRQSMGGMGFPGAGFPMGGLPGYPGFTAGPIAFTISKILKLRHRKTQ